jgi:hypothetical protein
MRYIFASNNQKSNLQNDVERAINVYTSGMIRDGKSFILSITKGFETVIAPENNRLYFSTTDTQLEIDWQYLVFHGNVVLSGVSLKNNFLDTEILFGCEFKDTQLHERFPELIKTNNNIGLLKHECHPMIFIRDILFPEDLRSRGLCKLLLLNIIELLESIRNYSRQRGNVEKQTPRILLDAFSQNFVYEGVVVHFYVGAAYWARLGFEFFSNNDRISLIRFFSNWAANSGAEECVNDKDYLNERIRKPLALLDLDLSDRCGAPGKAIGHRFLFTAPSVKWQGQLLIDESNESFTELRKKYSEAILY